MLDDLKKDRQTGFGKREYLKLCLYGAGLVLLGGVIYIGSNATQPTAGAKPATEVVEAPPGPTLDPVELDRIVRAEDAEPNRWAVKGIAFLRGAQRRGSLGEVAARPTPAALIKANQPATDAGSLRGRMVEVFARVSEVAREEYRPRVDSTGNERLWTVVLEGEDGGTLIGVKHALSSDVREGHPLDTKPPRVTAEAIAPDHWVLARGVYLQDRRGSFGDTQLNDPVPVLFVTGWRIVTPPDQRNPMIADLDEALWGAVSDHSNRESRNWEEDAVYETLRWARERGYEQIKADIKSGALPWSPWTTDRFTRWSKEVRFKRGMPRPLTEGGRGKLFRLSGIVAEVLQFGWERIPRNPWGVDEFQMLTLLSDHYQTVAFRSFLPYPIDTFEGVKGTRAEHLYVYGVFVKNFTYDTGFKHEDGSGRARPVTTPMFVVLHAERFPEEAAAEDMRAMMTWVAGSMVLFALLFYFVLIRGGRKQNKRMDEHRAALRKRAREKAQAGGGAAAEGADAPEPPGDAT